MSFFSRSIFYVTIKFFLFRFVKSWVKECHRFPDTTLNIWSGCRSIVRYEQMLQVGPAAHRKLRCREHFRSIVAERYGSAPFLHCQRGREQLNRTYPSSRGN